MYNLSDIKLEDIELKIEASDWKEAIRKASRSFLERGIIEEKYVEAMINSVLEFGPYIVLSENIALAHARPEDGAKETGLYFTSLKQPIEFGAEDFDPVKLLIVLSAKDSDSHINLLTQLSEIMQDRDVIEKLIDTNDKQEFANIIKEALVEI